MCTTVKPLYVDFSRELGLHSILRSPPLWKTLQLCKKSLFNLIFSYIFSSEFASSESCWIEDLICIILIEKGQNGNNHDISYHIDENQKKKAALGKSVCFLNEVNQLETR